jgi:hypothetical protein
VPPLAGVALNVTLVPEQIVLPGFAEIVTAGVTVALTVTAVAEEIPTQPLASVTVTE